MAVVTLQSSERSQRKARFKSTLRGSGSRHGDSFWTEEKERKNFGLSYMSKFGWSAGEGLGKRKQGNTSHVKTRYKNDTKGIGCTQVKSDTMFQATMFMFNDILSNLNQKKKKSDDADNNTATSTPSSSSAASSQQHMSASAVIKSYEAKHHLYGRFRAAKMIANRSEQDKAELFGRVDTSGFTENDQEAYATHLNALSMQRSGKMGLGFHSNDDDRSNESGVLMFGRFTSSGHITREDLNGKRDAEKTEKEVVVVAEEEGGKKKKKSKKNSKKDKKTKESIEIERAPDADGDDDVGLEKVDKKKKKKKKKKDKQSIAQEQDQDMNIAVHDTIEMNTATADLEGENETESISNKKKKKDKKSKTKKNSKRKRMSDSLDGDEPQEPPSKKLKLDDLTLDGNVSEASSTASIFSALPTPVQSETELEVESNTDAGKKRKKDKKRKKKKKDKSKAE